MVLSDKNIRAAITELLKQVDKNSLGTNEKKKQEHSKETELKGKEPNRNYRTEKYKTKVKDLPEVLSRSMNMIEYRLHGNR